MNFVYGTLSRFFLNQWNEWQPSCGLVTSAQLSFAAPTKGRHQQTYMLLQTREGVSQSTLFKLEMKGFGQTSSSTQTASY